MWRGGGNLKFDGGTLYLSSNCFIEQWVSLIYTTVRKRLYFINSYHFLWILRKSGLSKAMSLIFLSALWMILHLNFNAILFLIFSIILIFFSKEIYFWLFIIIMLSIFFMMSFRKNNIIMFLLILFILSSIWVILSNTIILIWIGLESQSFCVIVIILALQKNKLLSIESLFKIFIVTAFSGIVLIISISELIKIGEDLSILSFIFNNKAYYIWFLINLTFIFKIAIFPFQIWLFEVYAGLTFLGIFLLSILPKITLLILLIQSYKFYGFFILGFFSIIIGSIGGLNQNNIKLLLAYSSLAHLGVIILLLSLNSILNNINIVFLILLYFFSMVGVFIILCLDEKKYLLYHWKTSYQDNSWLTVFLSIFILSLLGIPPMVGFFGKLVFLIDLFSLKIHYFTLIIIISFLVSGFFYVRWIKYFINEDKKDFQKWVNINSNRIYINYYPINILLYLIFTIIFLVFIYPLMCNLCY